VELAGFFVIVDFDSVFMNQLVRELEYLVWVLKGEYDKK
jgi:hypothetical protein